MKLRITILIETTEVTDEEAQAIGSADTAEPLLDFMCDAFENGELFHAKMERLPDSDQFIKGAH